MVNVEPEEVDMLKSSLNFAQGNLMMQSEAKFRVLEKKVHVTNYVKQLYSNISSSLEKSAKLDEKEKTDGEKLHFCAENILVWDSSQL